MVTGRASRVQNEDRTPPIGSADWWRQRPPRRQRLSVERITAASLAVLDAEGAEAMTMRRVASELDVAAPSLYRHIASRDELLVHVFETVLGEVELDVGDGSWDVQAARLARAFRGAFHRHPGLAPLVSNTPTLGPNALAAFDVGLQICRRAGFPDDLAVAACHAIAVLVRAFAVLEAGEFDALGVAPGALTRFPARAYSRVESVSDRIGAPRADEMFEFFLEAILDALERRRRDEVGDDG